MALEISGNLRILVKMSFIFIMISLHEIEMAEAGGCRTSPEIELVEDKVYGCPTEYHGNWAGACNWGYHICKNAKEVAILELTNDICASISTNEIFLSLEQVANTECESYPNGHGTDGKHRLWGCSSAVSNPNIESNSCGVLNAAIDYYANDDNDDLLGALCCVNAPKTGCEYWTGHIHEEILPTLYGCPHTTECGKGYHLCYNTEEVEGLGLTSSLCSSISSNNNDIFFATDESDKLKCNSTNIEKQLMWGCSSSENDIMQNSCGVLSNAMDFESIANDFANFGVLCCQKGTGCVAKGLQKEVIANKTYACAGNFTDDVEIVEEYGCNAFYHVCNSAEELETLGLSPDQCSNITDGDEFYATLEGIQENNNKCSKSIDGIWGCSGTPSSDTSEICSPLNNILRNGKLSDADGILCCSDGDWIDIEWQDMSYMVSLRVNGHSCGGSILTLDGHKGNGAILIAAHCVCDKKGELNNKHTMKIAVGCTSTSCDDIDKDQIYSVDKIVRHEDYGGTYYQGTDFAENDIAIIFLTRPINHTNAIPIIIESDPMIAENNGVVKLTGYYGDAGSEGQGGSDITELEYALTNIVSREECTKYHDSVITQSDFCVKDDVANDGNIVTICQGDSGSPLLYKGKQLGIASFGRTGCDPFYPQVATYVPSYLQWIIENCGSQCLVNDGYLGCYKDEYNPALTKEIIENKFKNKYLNKYEDKFAMKDKDKRFTIDKCKKKCNGYKYFALQNDGRKCFCENAYNSTIKYGISRECGLSKLGGVLSNSLFVHSGFEQKQYLPDNVLQNEINLRYGPGKGATNNVVYTVESCRISCSNFKYYSVSTDGECKCDNEYSKSYNEEEYDRHGLFKNVLRSGIEINVNCDNFLNNILFKNDEYNEYVSVPLLSGESYPYDDWTKTQTVMLPNSANCGKVKIVCENAENDDGPAGIMIGIKYNKQYVSSNKKTINQLIRSENEIVLSSQTSTTPLSDAPYYAKWIWTCGDDGQWEKCGVGLQNTFEIDLCELSVAHTPNIIDLFIPKDKTVIYLFLSIISLVFNIVLVYVFCCKSSKKYTKVKSVQFDEESDVDV